MITLLRNLTNISQPDREFDCLPDGNDTSPGADLTRIKFYRNQLSHLDDAKVETFYFNTAWEVLSEVRYVILWGSPINIGGYNVLCKCNRLFC